MKYLILLSVLFFFSGCAVKHEAKMNYIYQHQHNIEPIDIVYFNRTGDTNYICKKYTSICENFERLYQD